MGKKNVSASNEGIGGHNVLQGGAFCDVSWQIGILQGLPSEVVYRAEYLGKIIQQHKNLGKICSPVCHFPPLFYSDLHWIYRGMNVQLTRGGPEWK